MTETHLQLPRMGDRLPTATVRPTEVQLFRFSAATWNPHRIHFDRPYAESEGYPGVLVQSHLHASFLAQYVSDWAGASSDLLTFSWQNRAYSTPADTLHLDGQLESSVLHDRRLELRIALTTTNQDRTTCVTATANISVAADAAESLVRL